MNIFNQRYFMIFYFTRCRKDILRGYLRLLFFMKKLKHSETRKKKIYLNIFQSKIENILFCSGGYLFNGKIILNKGSFTFNHVKKIPGTVAPTPLTWNAVPKLQGHPVQNKACSDNLM